MNITGKIKKNKIKKQKKDINGKKITRIYLVWNINNIPYKVYIGKEKSHQKKSRKSSHIKTFGNQINFEFIDKIKGWEKENWKPLETKWIKWFKEQGYEVVNKNNGGGGTVTHSINTKLKMSKIRKGVKQSEKHKLNRSLALKNKPNLKLAKSILQYDMYGNFVREWISIREAAKSFGDVSKMGFIGNCLRGKIKQAYNFQWKYKTKNYPLNIGVIPKQIVLQYNLNMNLIKEWDSLKEVSNKLKINSGDICACISKRQKTAGGYVWKYK